MFNIGNNSNKFKTILLKFIIFCIPTRLLMVLIAWAIIHKYKSNVVRYATGILGIIIGVTFIYLHFSGIRQLSVDGNKVWWNRLIHSLFYLAFGIMMLINHKKAYLLLLGDAIYGSGSFIVHHIKNGDFDSL